MHQHAQVAKEYNVPPKRGHFNGHRGSDGARMARSILAIAGHLRRKHLARVDMVVLLWDMDGKTTERKRGLLQAREAAALPPGCEGMAIAYGCPDFEIEAWLLGGFQPRDDDERERLAAQHATLGFDPVTQAHRLTAARDHDKHGVPNPRSAKVVLASLTADDHARRQACWQETPLVTLRQRGEHNGLRDYLDEVLHAVDSWAGKNVRLA